MLVRGDIVLTSLVLTVAICLAIIRRKLRNAALREEEIKRLLVLASEESARAEFESVTSYGVVSPFVSKNNSQCAVCFSPTTKICARCKSVRYCSGKCQIVHWRQGHKEECQSTTTSYLNKNGGSNFVPNSSKQEQHGISSEGYGKSSVVTSTKSPSSDSGCAAKVTHEDTSNVKVDCSEDAGSSSPISESSGASFSGFSSSPSSSESSDDVSVVGSISSDEAERYDGHESADIGPGISESSLEENLVQTESLSPKFSCLVGTVAKTIDTSVTVHGKVSSGFLDRTINSVATNDARDGSAHCISVESDNNKLSAPESFLHFKFNLSGSSTSSSHTKTPENISGTQGTGRPVDTGVVSKDTGVNTPKTRSFSSSNLEMPHTDKDATESKIYPSSESKSASSSGAAKDFLRTDGTKGFSSPSMSSNSSNPVTEETPSNSHLPNSMISSPATSLASRPGSRSLSSQKYGKLDNIETCSPHSSQMTCSSSSVSGLKPSMWKVVDQFKGPKSGRYSDKGLFSYDLFVKLYTSSKVDMRPCGLINCGNSCYANSVLQCLAFTPPLTAYFVQGLHSNSCVNKEWCFTCEFEKLILKVKEGKSPLSPSGILSQLRSIGSQLGNGREEDAHEFLRYAIDTMQAVCLKEAGLNASGCFEEETTLLGLTFGGYLRSKIKCMKCQHKSERQERMMDLTVEIGGDIDKLEDALKRFTGTEILDGENKYQCNRCKSYEKGKKKLTILEAPNVLTIALKRFQSGKFGKLNKLIRFPEILDLAPYMSGTSDKSPIYRLYGVVVHLDTMNAAFSGHYVCYVKNVQNKWFKIDDSTVTPVELKRVLAEGAYILLYARCSPRAPKLLRNPPAEISAKNTLFCSRSASARSNVVSDNTASVESFYLKFHCLRRILEEDSSSDNFSFTSSNSDEGSCSTDSTRDSTSTDGLSDYIFGGCNSPWKSSSDSDTSSSSSSPLYAGYSPQTNRHIADQANHDTEDDRWDGLTGSCSRPPSSDGDPLPHSDTYNQCRKLNSSSSSNSIRETDMANLGSFNPVNEVKHRVSFGRSTSEKTD